MSELSEFTTNHYERWKKEVEAILKGASIEKLNQQDEIEEILMKPLYTVNDIIQLEWLQSLPQDEPFVRGFHIPEVFPRKWKIVKKTSANELNEIVSNLNDFLDSGFNAIEIMDNTEDILSQFPKIATLVKNKINVSINSYSDPTPVLSEVLTKIQDKELLSYLTFTFDPITEFFKHNSTHLYVTWRTNYLNKLRSMQEFFFPVLKVDGCYFHCAGANIIQELGIAMAIAVEYLRAFEELNLNLTQAPKAFQFSFGIGSNFLLEVAKLRAARILWNHILNYCKIPISDRSMWIHCETSMTNLTIYDIETNLLRTTTEALAAILGSADSIWIAPYDAAVNKENKVSEHYAKNIHLIIREETHLADLMDPIGGSYAIESLTNQIAEKAYLKFIEIEKQGGIISAKEEGLIHRWIEDSVQKRVNSFIHRKKKLIGINESPNPNEVIPQQRVNSDTKVSVADGSATTHVPKLKPFFEAEILENIRTNILQNQKLRNDCTIAMVTIGETTSFIARYDFTKSFFDMGGFNVLPYHILQDLSNLDLVSGELKTDIIAICSSDKIYSEQLEKVIPQIKSKLPKSLIFLMGQPKSQTEKEQYQKIGIDYFIHNHSNLVEIFSTILKWKGIEK